MATFFGEVLSLSSRATDVDADFEINEHTGYKVVATHADGEKIACDLLVVGSGEHAHAYLMAGLEQKSPVGSVAVLDHCDRPVVTVHVYQLQGKNILVADCQKPILPLFDHELCEKIITTFVKGAPSRCLTLTSKPIVSNHSADSHANLDVSCLRNSSAKTWSGWDKLTRLSQPNILDGLSAAVMNYCELNDIACVCVLSWHRSQLTDDKIEAANQFQMIAQAQGLSSVFKDPREVTRNLHSLCSRNLQQYV